MTASPRSILVIEAVFEDMDVKKEVFRDKPRRNV